MEGDNMSGRKKMYFQSMFAAFDILNNINANDNWERFIFYTSFGTIVGKPKELFNLDFEGEEEIAAALLERFHDNQPTDAISVGNSFYLDQAKRMFDKDENDADDQIAIALEDVIITDHRGNITNSNIFMLYFDQVIGFMPFPNEQR